PGERLATGFKGLVVNINGWLRFAEQHPLAPPIFEKLPGPGVAVVALVVARFLAIENQADHVGRVLFVKLVLQRRTNHIVGWSHHGAQRADMAQVVTNATKRLNLWHGSSGPTRGRRRMRNVKI